MRSITSNSMAKLSMNVVTTYRLPLRQSLELYQRHGFRHVALWRDGIDPLGVKEVRRMADDLGLKVNNICGWLMRDKASITFDDRKASVDVAAELGATAIAALAPPYSANFATLTDCRAFGLAQMAQLLDHARQCNIKLALEPIHPQAALVLSGLNSIEEAADWCRQLGYGIGLELDTCNVWHEAHLSRQIANLVAEGLVCGVQICDAPRGAARERVVMGRGVADVAGFVQSLRAAKYGGLYEIELLGETLWDKDPEVLMQEIVASCAALGF